MFGNLITNVLTQVVNNAWNIAATVSLYRMYEHARNNQLTWRNTIKGIIAAIVNFGFFYCSPTIARKIAELGFPLIYGNEPSWSDIMWSPLVSAEYYHNETRVIEYAIEYGPLVILPFGQKISIEIVDLFEKIGIKMMDIGMDIGTHMLEDHPNITFSPLAILSNAAHSVGDYLSAPTVGNNVTQKPR
ncbi:hypothetical protein CC99x_004720 [Candidatus Berkiella cookevillensis]|uniref:Uncharacterized protein n=1 Tax=Candidatus Berkiella cookevillensis TaxID=437022 RepID=A0A0Q9YHW0_9GAMM|nr:hypothetical protein [Candidatus Berkiella cookevillensis]MCS5708202.1 hypothetical protein [Candidatus Berkiella cookevillensis]